MRIVLTTWGTSGDIEPFAAIGAALQARGADVVIFTNPYFAESLEKKGCTVRTFGEHWAPTEIAEGVRLSHPHFGPLRVWKELYLPRMITLYRELEAYLREHEVDLVLNHLWCFGGHYAAREAGVPTGFVTLAPLAWFSSEDPSYVGPLQAPPWVRRWSMKLTVRPMARMIFGRSLRQTFSKVGLSLSKDAFFTASSECACNIGLWSSAWRGPAVDDPPRAWIDGFPKGTAPLVPLDPIIEAFLQEGDAPVVMGLGSALPVLAPELYRETLRACQALGQRVILVGGPMELAQPSNKDVLVVPYAPFRSLFPRAKVIVHHGGIGTLAEALVTGKPAVIIPFANDQFDNAFRSQDLGVAVVRPREKVTPQWMQEALRRCLEDQELIQRAQRLGKAIQDEACGVERVADAILAGKASPLSPRGK